MAAVTSITALKRMESTKSWEKAIKGSTPFDFGQRKCETVESLAGQGGYGFQ